MYNILLDKSPTEYQGYLIRTDFRIGIQIQQALEDIDLDETERTLNALVLLYGNGIPDDINIAINGLRWFLSCGEAEEKAINDTDDVINEIETDLAYDFDIDNAYIYSAFYQMYGISLDKDRLHWFKFIALFKSLKNTALSDIMYYRTVDTSKMSKEQKAEYNEIKRRYKIHKATPQKMEQLKAIYGSKWKNHI